MRPTLPPYADIRPIKLPPRPRLALAALACAAGIGLPSAASAECTAAASPGGAAGTSALYGELSNAVKAEPLSVDITAKPIGGTCTWVYEVKVLTPQGNVAILDFDLGDLDLRHVDGPVEDPEVARLMTRLGENAGADGADPDATADDGSDDADSGESGEGGEGGSSGSGSDGGGSDGGGSDGSGSEGGSGGGGHSGSGGSGGGEGGGGSGGGGGEGGGEH